MITKQKKKIDLLPYESTLQNLNEIDRKSIKSFFLPSPRCHLEQHPGDLPITAFCRFTYRVLIDKMLSFLTAFEQLTKEISSSDASVADVIPLLVALKRTVLDP